MLEEEWAWWWWWEEEEAELEPLLEPLPGRGQKLLKLFVGERVCVCVCVCTKAQCEGIIGTHMSE